MADVATIVGIVGGAIGAVGGSGGLLAVWQAWRQAERETTHDIWGSFKEQIASAEARNDTEEAARVRREYEAQQEAWRAQQGVVALAPKETVSGEGARLTSEEVEQLKDLLARSDSLAPSLLSAHDYFLRGNAYFTDGDYEKALEAYNRALDLRPDHADTLTNRGAALASLGRNEDALAEFNRSLEIRSDEPTTLYNRGATLGTLGRQEEAIADYSRALELRPDRPATLNNRGAALIRLERVQEALLDFSRALKFRPHDPATLNNRGAALHALGRPEEALPDYNRSLEIRADDPETLSNRGLALRNLRRHNEALADFNRALELRPGYTKAEYNLACLFSAQGRPRESIEWLEKAIGTDSQYRAMAREDEDFENLGNDPEYGPRFRELVGEDEPARD